MADALAPVGRWELIRALDITLHEPPTPLERRQLELGPLAGMLDERARLEGIMTPRRGRRGYGSKPDLGRLDQRFPVVSAATYDAHRPAALSSEALTARFGGSWRRCCRAVWGLNPDGGYQGISQPWPGSRGVPRPAVYSRDECIAAVRACAMRFARLPTATLYRRWSQRRREVARRAGAQVRLPNLTVIRRQLGDWRKVLTACGITSDELAQARREMAERIVGLTGSPTQPARPSAWEAPIDRLTKTSDTELAAARLNPETVRAAAPTFADLPISQAAGLAGVLGGSLDWLSGRQEDPGPSCGAANGLDPAAVRRLRVDRGITEATLRRVLSCTLSQWRQLTRANAQPTLGQTVTLAALFDTRVSAIVQSHG